MEISDAISMVQKMIRNLSKLEIPAPQQMTPVFQGGGEHILDTLTTYPYVQKYFERDKYAASSKGPIIVEDDVWIGRGSTILSGVTVGKGAVIGAESVVVHDVPSYAIVAGNPARFIRYRFDTEIVERLKSLDYSSIELEDIRSNFNIFEEKINSSNIDNIIETIQVLKRQ